MKNPGENIDGHGSNKHVKAGKTAAGKTASLPVKTTFNSSQNLVVSGESYEDLKSRNQLDVSGTSSKKKTEDADKQKIGVHQSKNPSDKYKDASGLLDASRQKYHEKSAHAHSKSQPGRPSSNIDDLENTGWSKENFGVRELPDLNLSVGKSTVQAPVSLLLLPFLLCSFVISSV